MVCVGGGGGRFGDGGGRIFEVECGVEFGHKSGDAFHRR